MQEWVNSHLDGFSGLDVEEYGSLDDSARVYDAFCLTSDVVQ